MSFVGVKQNKTEAANIFTLIPPTNLKLKKKRKSVQALLSYVQVIFLDVFLVFMNTDERLANWPIFFSKASRPLC